MTDSFSNRAIDLAELPAWEEISFRPISARYRYVVYLNIFVGWLLLCGTVVGAYLVTEVWSWDLLVAALCGISVLMAVFLGFNLVSLKRRGYALREHDVLYRAGIFYHYTLIIPFRHIQHVKINEGLMSRMFGLVAIELFTAGAGRDMRVVGIGKADAQILQQHLSERISTIRIKVQSNDTE